MLAWYNKFEVIEMAKSDAQIRANAKWERKAYDKILLRLRKDSELNGDALRQYAESRGESTNSFIIRAIKETMARDKAGDGMDG